MLSMEAKEAFICNADAGDSVEFMGSLAKWSR